MASELTKKTRNCNCGYCSINSIFVLGLAGQLSTTPQTAYALAQHHYSYATGIGITTSPISIPTATVFITMLTIATVPSDNGKWLDRPFSMGAAFL